MAISDRTERLSKIEEIMEIDDDLALKLKAEVGCLLTMYLL